ncbi:MAG: 4-hydroxy-3-methylbut-2-enyl diphosphate reductase [Algicola sp.]|nr:4-hydroxy-3-methylbut-2-enyl diphosphate reductase [Algicola sp.]
MNIHLANPRGFCAGVDRAISIVERALELFEHPIYVRHEVVHNKFVVEGLKRSGAIFVDELDEVPEDKIVIFSAHGVSQEVRSQAKARNLKVFDATCPLVTKVHMEVSRASRKGIECVLIGHNGHPEVEGTMGQYDNADGGIYLVESVADVANLPIKDPDNLTYCSQTTLSVDDTAEIVKILKQTFANIKGPHKEDICYATQNRQDAVRDLAAKTDLVLVVGAKNSSNSNRLAEVAQKLGTESYLIDNADSIQPQWLTGKDEVGVTAGASAPDVLVSQVIDRLVELGGKTVNESPGIKENTVFALPIELR